MLSTSPLTTAVLALALAATGLCRPAAAAEPKPARADFSGTWQLEGPPRNDSLSKLKEGETPDPVPGSSGAAPGPGARAGAPGAVDLPWELLEDDRRLTVTDDGRKVVVVTSQGKRRTVFTDGEEREVDDENGPAKVKAKRKGPAGEKITISTRWLGGRAREETWELLESPRRIVVKATVHSPRANSYSRTYVPAAPLPIAAPPAARPADTGVSAPADPAPVPDAPTPESPAPAAAPARVPIKECSIRPPARTPDAELARMARLSAREAEAKALAAVAPRKPSGVISGEPEAREGCLVYSFFLRFPGGKEAEEVVVDAGDGKLLAPERE